MLRAIRVQVTSEVLLVELSDGRTVTAPLDWFPRLLHGTRSERKNLRLIGGGQGIHWPDLDEDVSVDGLLKGKASGESPSSFRRWLATRPARRLKPLGSDPAPRGVKSSRRSGARR